MQSRAFAGIVLVSLLTVGGGVAQSPSCSEKPVWSMEFIKVKLGMFGLALGYLDDDWMRVREEAKHQGAVLSYHRVGEQDRILPSGLDEGQSDGTIVLLTEYKNQATYERSEKLFESIREHLPENAGRRDSGLVQTGKPDTCPVCGRRLDTSRLQYVSRT